MANVFDQFDAGNPFDKFDTPKAEPVTKAVKLVKGLRDPVDAGAQLLTKVLPDGVVEAGNKFNNWLADKTGLVGKLPAGGVDQQVREAEQVYQAGRRAAGEEGFDGYRLIGNVANPANFAVATKLPVAASLAGRMGIGAGFGGASSALFSPVTEGDFWTEKGKQAAVGAAGGAAVPVVTGALSRVISPNNTRNPLLRMLKDEGVDPTLGQTLGGRWNVLEEKATSIPIVGDAIASGRRRAVEQFNNAAINRATAPIGVRVPGTGQQAVQEAGDALSTAYGNALGRVRNISLDQQFGADLGQLHGMAQNLTEPMRNKFNRELQEVVMRQVSPQGSILGSSFKGLDSELGNLASRYSKSAVASEAELGDAFRQLQALLREQMVRSNPGIANELRAADAGWANLVRVEGAAKAAHNAEGIFTPGQLNGAIRAADNSVRKRAVARGTALLQDLGNAGQTVLGNKVPDSGTTGRALTSLAAGGGLAVVEPNTLAAVLGLSSLYTRPGNALVQALIGSRPQAAEPVANALRQASPGLLPFGSQIGPALLYQDR